MTEHPSELPPPFTIADLKRVAQEELVTTESVLRVMQGLEVRGAAGVRARRAAARLRGA